MTLTELRAKHPRFLYQRAEWQHSGDTLSIRFHYLLEPDIAFSPSLTLRPISAQAIEKLGRPLIDQWVFHLGLVEQFSYWKLASPSQLVIQAGFLNKEQLAWWKNLLIKGMGEFFYTNQIDFTDPDFVTLSCDQPAPAGSVSGSFSPQQTAPKYLVPVGGGKDSSLVIELLEENALPYDILLSHPQSPAAEKIAQLSRAQTVFQLHRAFDPQLFELNKQEYLSGHTPFSARLAMESSMTALLTGRQYVLVANEHSANEGNVPFHDTVVNHQYSKTFEFEQAFRQYAKQYLSPAPEYLSLLRPIYELQIAGLFAGYPRYHSLFKSCNRNQQQESWCCNCPKCLFVFSVLSPFLEEKQLIGPIFPENLFEKASLQTLALELLGKDKHKPFECVGTYDETLAAFYLSARQFRRRHPNQPLPPVLQFLEETVFSQEKNLDALSQEVLCFWSREHHLPPELETLVHAAKERFCKKFRQL